MGYLNYSLYKQILIAGIGWKYHENAFF
jgi:hypothetical protein